jgi:hypothetical protein
MIVPGPKLVTQHLNRPFEPSIELYPDGLVEIRCIHPNTKAADAKLFAITKTGLAAAID